MVKICPFKGKKKRKEKWKKKMKKKKRRKKGRKEWRKGGRREANPHCRPQRQTREQNLGELSLGNPYNEPQEFFPGSRSPKHQVQPPRV